MIEDGGGALLPGDDLTNMTPQVDEVALRKAALSMAETALRLEDVESLRDVLAALGVS